jgi:hypothetical protein
MSFPEMSNPNSDQESVVGQFVGGPIDGQWTPYWPPSEGEPCEVWARFRADESGEVLSAMHYYCPDPDDPARLLYHGVK